MDSVQDRRGAGKGEEEDERGPEEEDAAVRREPDSRKEAQLYRARRHDHDWVQVRLIEDAAELEIVEEEGHWGCRGQADDEHLPTQFPQPKISSRRTPCCVGRETEEKEEGKGGVFGGGSENEEEEDLPRWRLLATGDDETHRHQRGEHLPEGGVAVPKQGAREEHGQEERLQPVAIQASPAPEKEQRQGNEADDAQRAKHRVFAPSERPQQKHGQLLQEGKLATPVSPLSPGNVREDAVGFVQEHDRIVFVRKLVRVAHERIDQRGERTPAQESNSAAHPRGPPTFPF